MADRLWRAQVTIPMDSALPEDSIVNVWHFDDDDDPVAAPDDTRDWVMQALTGFYNSIDGVVYPNQITSTAQVKLYDLRDPEPRIPIFTEPLTITPNAADMLPAEVALCLSFAAAPESGTIAARRRGRIFLGPLHTGAVEYVAGQARPTSLVMNSIKDAAAVLVDGISHPGSPGLHLKWAIYSPTTDLTSSIDDAFNDVVSGWVDNAFDTQRRRGAVATSRVTFS